VRRLHAEAQVVGRRRGDVEAARGGAAEAAVAGGQGVAAAGLVDGQGAEAGEAASAPCGDSAAVGAAAGGGADGHLHVRGVEGHQVVELVEHPHCDGGADGHAGHGVRRLHAEDEVIGGGGGDVERPRGGTAEAAVGGGQGVAAADLVDGQGAEAG